MKTTRKTLLVLAMIVATLLTVAPIHAGTDTQSTQAEIRQREPSLALQAPEPVELDDLDEAVVAEKIRQATEAEAVTKTRVRPIWVVHTVGWSWPLVDEPTVDAAPNVHYVGTTFAARKIKQTQYGAVYEVLRGSVYHAGRHVQVGGIALLDNDGVFYLSLEGDSLDLKAIGRVRPTWYGYQLGMKGLMDHSGRMFSFKMFGWAVPLHPRVNVMK